MGIEVLFRTAPKPLFSPTPKEREVLTLRREGLTTRQIAERMGVQINTIKIHTYNYKAKGLTIRNFEAPSGRK